MTARSGLTEGRAGSPESEGEQGDDEGEGIWLARRRGGQGAFMKTASRHTTRASNRLEQQERATSRHTTRGSLQAEQTTRATRQSAGDSWRWALHPSKSGFRARSPGTLQPSLPWPRRFAVPECAASLVASPPPRPITRQLSPCLPLVWFGPYSWKTWRPTNTFIYTFWPRNLQPLPQKPSK